MVKMTSKFNDFSVNFVNPNMQLDARVFAMNTKLAEIESMHESHFAVVKDAVKKLIYALDTKNQGTAQQQSLLTLLMKN